LVVTIQVGALQHNDPATNEGINATWRFAASSNRQAIGSYEQFVNIISSQYEPLLNAETVTYGPLEGGDIVRQRVTVTTTDSETQSYVWYLEQQTGGRYDGCWMTTGVRGSVAESMSERQ